MCVPDLKGSQGTFSYYSSDPGRAGRSPAASRFPSRCDNGVVRSYISGPDNTMVEGGEEMRVPFEVRPGKNGTPPAELIIDGKSRTR